MIISIVWRRPLSLFTRRGLFCSDGIVSDNHGSSENTPACFLTARDAMKEVRALTVLLPNYMWRKNLLWENAHVFLHHVEAEGEKDRAVHRFWSACRVIAAFEDFEEFVACQENAVRGDLNVRVNRSCSCWVLHQQPTQVHCWNKEQIEWIKMCFNLHYDQFRQWMNRKGWWGLTWYLSCHVVVVVVVDILIVTFSFIVAAERSV